ncbi:hypothetical protein F2Q69_00036416 [Brassica cretica]|uniref:Uncharacterized protein n=1 Tax=Brassica cretica TaxID=69181 RepID=A0A8S9SI67_BRACR|nr:hypothetical protein F2Q69_00036416 [Brassica cretica]
MGLCTLHRRSMSQGVHLSIIVSARKSRMVCEVSHCFVSSAPFVFQFCSCILYPLQAVSKTIKFELHHLSDISDFTFESGQDIIGFECDGSSSIDVRRFLLIDAGVVASTARCVCILVMSCLISSMHVVNQLMLSFSG